MADKVKHIAIENSGGTTNYDIYDENSYVEIGKVDNKITNINNKIGTDNIGNKTITKAIKDLQESSTSAGVKTVDNIQPDSNGNIDLSDKYLKQKHEEKQGNTLEIGHVKLTDTLPAGVPDAQVNGVETGTAASGYAVQKVREDLTTKITEVSNKIPENIGTVTSVNGQKPNNAGAVIVTGSDIDYKTFLSGEISSSIADKFEEIDNKLLYSQKIAPILTEDFSPTIKYIEIKGLTFGDGDEAVNYKFASDVAANPSIEANPPVLNSITINGVDYAIKGGEGGGQVIQVSILPEASIGYLDVIYQYIGEDTEEYTNGYFYKCISELVEEEEEATYKWKAISVQEGGGPAGTTDYEDLENKPSINDIELSGNKTSSDLGLAPKEHTHVKSDITDFPTNVSDFTNDANYITIDDVQSIQVTELPEASEDNIGKIYQYIGEDNNYKNGYFYKCVSREEENQIKYLAYTSASTDERYYYAKENFNNGDYLYSSTLPINYNEPAYPLFTILNGKNAQLAKYPPYTTLAVINEKDSDTYEIKYVIKNQDIEISDLTGCTTYPLRRVESKDTIRTESIITYEWARINVQPSGGGEGGTSDYDELDNKPKIAGVTLIGDKSLADLGIVNFDGDYEKLTNKPDSFTPSAHTHDVEDITNLDLSTKVDVTQGADNKDKILKVNAEGNLALAEDAGGVDVSVENQVLKFKGGSSGTSSSIHEYSTTEHIVGKWIDGSDIWERTYDMSGKLGNKTDGYINVTEDIGKVIRFFGYGYSTTSKITIGFPHTNLTNDCCIFYNGNTKTIHLAVDADYSAYNEVYVTLQYLK